jgi:hypothetical protein
MNIYQISINTWDYDCYSEFIIAANTIDEVRKIASENSADEGGKVWIEKAEVQNIGIYTRKYEVPVIICSSFHAG